MSDPIRIDSPRASSPDNSLQELGPIPLSREHSAIFDLALNIFARRWQRENRPDLCSEEDLQQGVFLFSALAIEKAQKNNLHQDKVKSFIRKHGDSFWNVCKTRFPFNELEAALSKAALKAKLKHPEDSILFHFMNLTEGWMSDEELSEYFENSLDSVLPSEIGHTCFCLAKICAEHKNPKAGHYLLWLFKKITGAAYEIPEKEYCGPEAVQKKFYFIFQHGTSIQCPGQWLEILYYRSPVENMFLLEWLLTPSSCDVFFEWAISQFVLIPLKTWPGKAHVIRNVFERIAAKDRIGLAKKLTESPDIDTREIGHDFLADIANIFDPRIS